MWQVSRCDFDGRSMTVVYAGLRTRPAHFEIDPYNGYLFWSINGTSNESGIFRLDLSAVSNGVRREMKPYSVVKGPTMGPFTIDYAQFSLFIPIESKNTIHQIDFDGKKEEDIRQNTQSAEFTSVTSIAVAEKRFYWTNGPSVFQEEFHQVRRKYFHTSIFHFREMHKYLFVGVNSPSAQPTPVPTHPPSSVQVVLSEKNGKVSWNTPHLLSIQGLSSWQDWNYEIEVTNEDDNNTKTTVRDIKGLHHSISDLQPNTNYKVRVAAYTNGGYGQFSSEFRAKTLRSPHNRYLMWSSNDGLLRSDILGDHIEVVVPQNQLTSQNITGIAWFDDVIYFASNYTIFYFNRTSREIQHLTELYSVQSIAVDWIGRRLYWFNPLNGVISRGNLRGGEQEPLLPLTAREVDLKIDSHRGYMYLSSGHAVEYCRLNGKHRKEYYRKEVYSGKQVMGLTLDMDNERVYWIVRSYDSSSLIMAPMAGTSATNLQPIEYEVREKEIQGPLSYFSDRLLWLQDDHTVVISNVTGKNLAHLRHIKLNGLKAFSVVDPTQHTYPNVSGPINVIPGQLNASSIRITGNWESFNISWDPIDNVNYGEVFYDIRCHNLPNSEPETRPESKHPYIQISSASLQPYTAIDLSVRAFTYWGSSKVLKAQVYSPAAAPSQPTNPRIFLSHSYDMLNDRLNITATLRWNPPSASNGPLLAYKINSWYENDSGKNVVMQMQNVTVAADVNEMVLENLVTNATYFFEISACSSVEMGKFTPPLSIHTNAERPIPRVLVSTSEAILSVDLDLKSTETVVKTRSPATHLAYMSLHNELFWVDESFDLMTLKEGHRHKLCNASVQVLSMTVDWISRVIYWSQIDGNSGSALLAYNLNKNTLEYVIRQAGFIYGLTAVPQQQMVLWIETKMVDDIAGELYTFKPWTNRVRSYSDSSYMPVIAYHKTLVLDTAARDQMAFLWIDVHGQLISTDLTSKVSKPLGLMYNPNTTDLIKDSGRLYWKNEENHILAFNRDHDYEMPIENETVLCMLAFNQQEIPPLQCLIPQNTSMYDRLAVEGRKARSLTLKLPNLRAYTNCTVRPPGIKYTIRYRPAFEDQVGDCSVTTCKTLETYDLEKEVGDLKPFTKYQFQLHVDNHYSMLKNITIDFGPFFTFSTTVDAPSAPRNVAAEAINPTEALVTWAPPMEFNGNDVWYEVHWQTKHAINGVKNRQQLFVNESSSLGSENNDLFVTINGLLPKQPYNVWVRAYTTNTSFSESQPLEIETFPAPENITMTNATSHSFVIHWPLYTHAIDCVLYYKQWNNASDPYKKVVQCSTASAGLTEFLVEYLEPKTQYVFVVMLEFPRMKLGSLYEWGQFKFETLAGRPNAPGKPTIRHVSGDVYKVYWMPALDNGAAIEMYSLEALRYSIPQREKRSTDVIDELSYTTMVTAPPLGVEEGEPIEDVWTVYYNGTDTYWIIKDLVPIDKYSFRVRARNYFGWGSYSALSDIINAPLPSSERWAYMLIATIVPISITLLFVLVACLCCGKFLFYYAFLSQKVHATKIPSILYFFFSIPEKDIRKGDFLRSCPP